MLDEKDLQAIDKLIAARLDDWTQNAIMPGVDKLIAARLDVLMENEITPKFDMLADILMDLKEEVSGGKTASRLEDAEERLDVHEAVIRRHSADIEKLKKAQ